MIPVLVALLLLTLAAGFWRVIHGPTRGDQLLATQLFSTLGAAILLLLAEHQSLPPLRDAALVLALLAALVSAALVQFLRIQQPHE